MYTKAATVSRKAAFGATLCLAVCAIGVPNVAHAEGGLFGALLHLFGGPPPNRSGGEMQSPQNLPPIFSDEQSTKPRSKAGGPRVAYCVRTCDGRYFPISKSSGASTPAKTCRSMCPATETKIYSGNNIDNAVAHDGSKYSSLANAYRYRKHLVSSCTCNGKNPAGNTAVTIENDPTLRAGDIVMTANGPVVFTGPNGPHHKMSDFVPARESRKISGVTREKVLAMKAMPTRQVAAAAKKASITPRAAEARKPSRNMSNAFDFVPKLKSSALSYTGQ